jgi:hypothetical protein
MKKPASIAAVLALGAGLSACAARPAQPVAAIQPGDAGMSCVQLESEVMRIESDMRTLLPQTYKDEQNALAQATLVGLPLYDYGHAEQIEISALMERHLRLFDIAQDRGCHFVWDNATPNLDVEIPREPDTILGYFRQPVSR